MPETLIRWRTARGMLQNEGMNKHPTGSERVRRSILRLENLLTFGTLLMLMYLEARGPNPSRFLLGLLVGFFVGALLFEYWLFRRKRQQR